MVVSEEKQTPDRVDVDDDLSIREVDKNALESAEFDAEVFASAEEFQGCGHSRRVRVSGPRVQTLLG